MSLLTWQDYYEKTLGCWMGKNAGGTLGGPVEGRMETLNLDWYPVVQEGGIPNDDLEVQLVWLHAMETRGIDLTANDLAAEWLDHYLPNWCEYGFGKTNLRKGIAPPLSGSFNNWHHQSMGCPIRSEIWACVAPGLPVQAARMAREDAVVDHGPESAFAEMLFAVIESAAFLESGRDKLVELGLAAIPDDCRTANAVRIMVETWRKTRDWGLTRDAILAAEGRYNNFTDAPQNIAFTLLGWYTAPDDFGQAICDSVNCGFDTDCTAATLGSILGIAWGAKRMPEKWMKPLGESIAIIKERTRIADAPATLASLTDRTAALGIAFLSQQGHRFGPGCTLDLKLPTPQELRQQMQAMGLWDILPNTIEHRGHHARATVSYPGEPMLAPGAATTVQISLRNTTERRMEGPVSAAAISPGLQVKLTPGRIDVDPGEQALFTLEATLAGNATPQGHVDAVIALQAEGILPWTFPVSFVRPMLWSVAKGEDGALKAAAEPTVRGGEPMSVNGNAIPLTEPGTWIGTTMVLNPSAHPREVRICCTSNWPVRVWLNGVKAVENPGDKLVMPSYHCNAQHHYGAGVLQPGWNRLTAVWSVPNTPGETHLFLTTPEGSGWGDLVFEASGGKA